MNEKNKILKNFFYEDILYMISKIEEIHPCPYFNTSKEKIMNMLQEFKNNEEINTEGKFLYFANKIIKQFGDPHTIINIPKSMIPLKFRIIDNRVFIIGASNEYKDLIGQELTKINNIDINTIINELKEIVSFTMPEWANVEVQNKLSNLYCLWVLPIMDNSKNFDFEINGKIVKFHTNQKFNYSKIKNLKYSYHVDYENNLINIIYKKCMNDEEYPFEQFVKNIKSASLDNNINNFIVDLRGNSGGNSNIIMPLLEFLKDKNIVVLVDNGVFSSGSLATFDLKEIGSTIIGSHIGTTWNHFGECKKFETPNLKISLFISQKYFFYNSDKKSIRSLRGKENFNMFFSNPENQKFLTPQIFEPDIYVDYQIDDIFGNNMEQIAMEQIKNSCKTR